jgi:D-xylose 1-dehydrogenase (NADP+, D-xylono-1,5-lactone-forming)
MNTVRWGLVSTARINRRVIPPIHASKRGKLAAVASRDGEKAIRYAAEWQIPRTFSSYEEMIASDEIDAVYISLPNHLHAEWTIKALRAGKHVLCEKPFAITLDEVDRMIAASRETGLVLQEAFMYRHHPQTKLAKEWVQSGRLGEITLTRGIFSFSMNNPENVRMNPAWGGGCMWDVGVYSMSFSQYIYGQVPQTVFAQQHTGATGVDETFSGLMTYPGGASAHIAASFEMPFATTFEIQGTRGRININRPFTGMDDREREMIFTDTTNRKEKIKTPRVNPYFAEVENMNAAILDGAPTCVTLEETRDHIRTVLALYESARTGKLVSV